MSSSNQYLDFVLDLLGELDDVAHRKMMGEYVLYCRGKVFGGIYDDRFLLKVTPASDVFCPRPSAPSPTEGAKEMLLVEIEDRDAPVRRSLSHVGGATCAEEEKVGASPGLVHSSTRPGLNHTLPQLAPRFPDAYKPI